MSPGRVRRAAAAGAALAAAGLVASGGTAEGCPYCISTAGGTVASYYMATALLSLLPLAILGSILYWLRRASRLANQDAPENGVPPAPDQFR